MAKQSKLVLVAFAILLFSIQVIANRRHHHKNAFTPSLRSEVDRTLRFNSNGTFKIVQFTDLHYGEGEEKDAKNYEVQSKIIKYEQPDLVVLTGDSVSGYATNDTVGAWRRMVQPMLDLGQRWAVSFGNHDDQGGYSRTQLLDVDISYPLSLSQFGPSNIAFTTNYRLPVLSSDGSDSVVSNLYFFDSGDNNCEGVPGWGCTELSQVQWTIQEQQKSANENGGKKPSLGFLHIPVQEYMFSWNEADAYGKKDEAVCCSSLNTGLFSAAKAGEITAFFAGHDHNNDYHTEYAGITLAYGRKTGYGGYGPPPLWQHGARVIVVHENPFSMDTYIREEDGNIVTQQPLHSPSVLDVHQLKCCGADEYFARRN